MRQSQAELDGLSDVIGSIYDTVLDETLWPQTLQMICAYTGGRASRIYWRDASNGIGETVYSWGIDPEFIRLYREKFVTLNPTYPASIFIKPGEVFASSQLVAHDAFQASRFFREWAAPQGFFDAAIFNIQRYEASAAAFTVITGDQYGLVDERLRTRLRRLVPHIQRATLIRREIGRQEKRVRSLESALNHVEAAVFILGRTAWQRGQTKAPRRFSPAGMWCVKVRKGWASSIPRRSACFATRLRVVRRNAMFFCTAIPHSLK